MTKTEYRSAAKTALLGARDRIAAALATIEDETTAYLLRIARFEVAAGIGLAIIRETFSDAKTEGIALAKVAGIGTDDWREYATAAMPGRDVKTIYRWSNAGAVARVLGDLLPETALIGSLVPMYRLLSDAKTTEEKTGAADLVRETYRGLLADAGTDGDGVQNAPTFDAVLAACEKVGGTNRSGGSKTEKTKTVEDDGSDGSEEKTASAPALAVVDPAAVESASAAWSPQYRRLAEEHGAAAVQAIGLAVLRFAGEHGIAAMQHVLSGTSAPAAPVQDVASLAAAVLSVPTETTETPEKTPEKTTK